MRRLAIIAALVLLAGLAAPAPAHAQQTTGTIAGRVVDQSGAAVPGATVTALQAATGLTRTSVTDAVGVFRLPRCPWARTT